MKKRYNLEAASLRVLSGFYRNDMAFFSRHADERFLFDVPGHETGEQTPLSIRDLLLFPEDSGRYAVRKAAPALHTQCGPVCSILMKYTLDRYQNEIPDLQKACQLLICWLNVSAEADHPAWRITLFRISDDETGPETEKHAPGLPGDPATPRDALVRERRASYRSFRTHLVRITDKNHIVHFLEKDDIVWAESDRLHSVIHTHTGTIRTNTTLSQLAEDALSCLYRPHISYLINPRYLYQINKAHLIMTDGMVIPIPERRLAQVRKDLCQTF